MKITLALSAAAVALLSASVGAPAASAAVITQMMTANLSLGGSTTLDFNGFNPALGTLTDVTASLSGDVTTSLTVTNSSGQDEMISFGYFMGTAIANSTPPFFLSGSFDTSGCSADVAPGGTAKCSGTGSYGPTSLSGITPLADYSDGSVAVNVRDILGTGSITGLDPPSSSCCSLGTPTGTDDATVTLQYTYTPAAVPEASTWAMMLVGFAGLGFAAFRRSTKQRLDTA
jgi:hypothetical protein